LAQFVEKYLQQTSESNNEAYYIDKALCPGQWRRKWSDEGLRTQFYAGEGINNPMIEGLYGNFSNSVTQLVDLARKGKATHCLSMYCVSYADNTANREARLRKRDLHNSLIEFTYQFFILNGADVRIHTTLICLLARPEIAPVAEKFLG
jgi:hypothetical protein